MQMIYEHTIHPTNELNEYDRNSRTHSETQIDQIVASIQEFGFTNPILIDEEKTIIAGHGRVAAAKKLNLEEVPCITLTGLTEQQRRAYVIADNKLALNAGWDQEMLAMELSDLEEFSFDMNLLGFSDKELDKILDRQGEGDGCGVGDNTEYLVIVECTDEKHQESLYSELMGRNLEVRVIS